MRTVNKYHNALCSRRLVQIFITTYYKYSLMNPTAICTWNRVPRTPTGPFATQKVQSTSFSKWCLYCFNKIYWKWYAAENSYILSFMDTLNILLCDISSLLIFLFSILKIYQDFIKMGGELIFVEKNWCMICGQKREYNLRKSLRLKCSGRAVSEMWRRLNQ